LRRQLYRLQYALNLLGICGYDEAFYMAGANEKGTAEVRQFGRIRRTFYRSRDMPSTPFGLDELRRAVPLSERMEIIDKEGASWRRFRRGIDSLNDGLTERSLQDSRIHQFVRVLEGLILPEQGKSTKQFVPQMPDVRARERRYESCLGAGLQHPSPSRTPSQRFRCSARFERRGEGTNALSQGASDGSSCTLRTGART
jgi:hypothetical protein